MTERESTMPRRGIVSFVRRSPRMNPSQQRAWDAGAARWLVLPPRAELDTSVAPDAPPIDVAALFGRPGPLYVEIGSGMGESPVAFAVAHPERNVLAFEVYEPSVASTLGKIAAAGVDNLRVVLADAAAGLDILLPAHSVAELRVFFPDPWHKNRHHKRRLITAEFADVIAAKLVDDGRLLIATDWAAYADHVRAVLDPHPALVSANDPSGLAPRDPERPLTKYEQRGIAQGRAIADLAYRRRARDVR